MTQWTIYCHTHTTTERRYIGLTVRTMMRRWSQHVTQSRSSKGGRWHFPNAIRKYGPEAFSHMVLEVCDSLEAANEAEKRWIAEYDTRNPEKGFNLAEGGKSAWKQLQADPQRLAMQSEVQAARQATLNTPECKARRLASFKASRARPEVIAKFKLIYEDPSYRARIGATLKATLNTPESKARISAAVKKVWTRPEVLAKRAARVMSNETRSKLSAAGTGRSHTEESKSKQGEAARAAWSRPETREKQRAVRSTPEFQARMRKALQDGYARRQLVLSVMFA